MSSNAHFFHLAILSLIVLAVSRCEAIKCYHCHSHLNEACDDPFSGSEEVSTIDANSNSNETDAADTPTEEASLLVDCDTLDSDKNYTFCRKTVQTAVLGPDRSTVRIIRSCGFLEEPKLAPAEGDDPSELRCYRKTGTHSVELLYCACHTDGCNSGSMISMALGLLVLPILSSVMFLS